MDYLLLENNTEHFVTHLFESPHRPSFLYHNLAHTRKVVEHTRELLAFYTLDEMDRTAIVVAAWFHDVGQLFGEMEGHETRSVSIMEDYLATMDIRPGLVQLSADCIMATRKNAQPRSLQEKIICDADTWHFGTPYFRETEFLVKAEVESRMGKTIPDWHKKSARLLQAHVFFTEYCQLLLNKGKAENLAWLASLIIE